MYSGNTYTHIHVACIYSIAIEFTTEGNRVIQTHTKSVVPFQIIFSKNIVSSHGQTGLDTYVSCKSVCNQMDQFSNS